MPSATFAVSRGRLDALTDGLFAIAMTILVLELHAPDLPAGAGLPAFQEALRRQWPSVLGYVSSFGVEPVEVLLRHGPRHVRGREADREEERSVVALADLLDRPVRGAGSGARS